MDELEKMDESDEEIAKRMDEYYEWWKEEEAKEKKEREKKVNERKKLSLEIQSYGRLIRKNKLSRNITIIVVYALKNIFIIYNIIKPLFDESVLDTELELLRLILVSILSVIMATIGFYVNIFIFEDIINSTENEKGVLESKIRRLQEMDKELNIENDGTEQ